MLVIRREQMEAMSGAARASFRERLYEHVKKCWPRELEEKTSAGVRQSIERAITRAAAYGIKMEKDVVRYLDTMYLAGDGFDADSKTGWARAILDAPDSTPSAKALRIWGQAKKRSFPTTRS